MLLAAPRCSAPAPFYTRTHTQRHGVTSALFHTNSRSRSKYTSDIPTSYTHTHPHAHPKHPTPRTHTHTHTHSYQHMLIAFQYIKPDLWLPVQPPSYHRHTQHSSGALFCARTAAGGAVAAVCWWPACREVIKRQIRKLLCFALFLLGVCVLNIVMIGWRRRAAAAGDAAPPVFADGHTY